MAGAAPALTVDWFQLVVPGGPVPWARARRNGKRYFTDPKAQQHMERIRGCWITAGRPYLGAEAVGMSCQFLLPRPASHCGTGRNSSRVKPSAPLFPTGKPDIDNLYKIVADSLSGLAYADDAQIVELRDMTVRYAAPGEDGCTVVAGWVTEPAVLPDAA